MEPENVAADGGRAEAELLLAGDLPDEAALQGVVAALAAAHPAWGWVGIYLLVGDTLVLGPFVGPPTEHRRIPVGTGVCGTAVAADRNVVVDDVAELDNYLACSVGTRSEIVVLIRDGNDVVGQFDVDSDELRAFRAPDEALLAHLASLAAPRCRRLTCQHGPMPESERFPIRMSSPNGILFRGLLILPSFSYVELSAEELHVRLGWAFSARVPRRLIRGAKPGKRPTIPFTAGAHGWRGRWLVNGSSDGIVDVELSETTRAFVAGFPIHLKTLSVSLEDPDGFLAAVNGK